MIEDSYKILRQLGVGGMAKVVLVQREPGEAPVVVKQLLPQLVDRPGYVEQLVAEGRRMSLLAAEPGVVNVLDVVEPGGVGDEAHLVLEYVPGNDLASYQHAVAECGGRPALELALSISLRLAEILLAVHKVVDPAGRPVDLVHRDICPANVLLGPEERVVLIDFGVASGRWPEGARPSTDQGRAAYMAPEQVRGLDIDQRADLYSVGVVLFELVTGTRLYGTSEKLAVLAQIMDGVVHRPSERWSNCPASVEEIIMRCLAPSRDDRYIDGAELSGDLMAALMELGVEPSVAGARLEPDDE